MYSADKKKTARVWVKGRTGVWVVHYLTVKKIAGKSMWELKNVATFLSS